MQALRLAFDRFRSPALSAAAFEKFRRSVRRVVAVCQFRGAAAKVERPWWEWPVEWRAAGRRALRAAARERARRSSSMNSCNGSPTSSSAAARYLPSTRHADRALSRCSGRRTKRRLRRVVRPAGLPAPPGDRRAAGHAQHRRSELGARGIRSGGLETAGISSRSGEMLEASMRYAGAIRIDHVLGLKRLYVIPRGMAP